MDLGSFRDGRSEELLHPLEEGFRQAKSAPLMGDGSSPSCRRRQDGEILSVIDRLFPGTGYC